MIKSGFNGGGDLKKGKYAVIAAIVVLLLVALGFFLAWRIAKQLSKPVEWYVIESVDEEGNVTFTDDPPVIEQHDYTVWDVIRSFFHYVLHGDSFEDSSNHWLTVPER